jgi:hypothetical protein
MSASVSQLSLAAVQAYRKRTFRLEPGRRVRTQGEAIAFVGERGFVFFWPIKEVVLPSLWVAVAGDRPVPAEHDDPGHVTWRWKDSLWESAAGTMPKCCERGPR